MQDQAKADGGLNVARQKRPGLCDPHVQRIRTFLRHQFMGLHTHQHIGRLDAHHQVVIAHILDHMYLLHGALGQAFCCNASVFLYQRLLQGTTVDAHPDGNACGFGLVHHRLHPVPVSDIPRVDPDLVRAVPDGRDSQPVIKMDIRHQRDMDLFLDLLQRLRRLHGRHRASDDLAPRLLQSKDLGNRSLHILCTGIGH